MISSGKKILSGLLFSVIVGLLWNPIVSGEMNQSLSSFDLKILEKIWFNTAGKFDDEGKPTSRSSGGSRSQQLDCIGTIVALVPGEGTIQKDADGCVAATGSMALLAKTENDQPILWFYITLPSDALLRGEIELATRSGEFLVAKEVDLLPASGVFGILMPQALDEQEVYQWRFSVLEYPKRPSKNSAAEGWIQWQPSDQVSRGGEAISDGAIASLRHDAARLSQDGYWHDAVTVLAQARRDYSENAGVKADWSVLLSSIGLETFTEEAVLQCCEGPAVYHLSP